MAEIKILGGTKLINGIFIYVSSKYLNYHSTVKHIGNVKN